MRILFIYHRDMSPQDGGASRTIVSRMNYFATQCHYEVYTSFKVFDGADKLVTQLSCNSNTAEEYNRLIVQNQIDILAVPEGELLISLGYSAVQGTSCKIVAELHSKPGYECLNLISSIIRGRRLSFKSRLKAYMKIIVFPLYKLYIRRKARPDFQSASLLSDKFVVLSDSYIEEYKKAYKLPNAKNIVAIGNPLSFATFANKEQIEKKDKTILVVSRLDETAKRISIAIKAWSKLEKQHPDWKMEIVGSGESEQLYLNMIAKLELKNITLCGQQNPEVYYEKASIFLMTSAYEGFPMVINEAIQKGCVPVAMNSYSALGYIINDGQDGFITSNNDLTAFLNKINYLIENSDIRKEMALRGVDNCKRFSVESIGKQWVELYNKVVKS